MKPIARNRTAIEVRYYLPERRREKLETLGEKYRCSCERLRDQDETMMMYRKMGSCAALGTATSSMSEPARALTVAAFDWRRRRALLSTPYPAR